MRTQGGNNDGVSSVPSTLPVDGRQCDCAGGNVPHIRTPQYVSSPTPPIPPIPLHLFEQASIIACGKGHRDGRMRGEMAQSPPRHLSRLATTLILLWAAAREPSCAAARNDSPEATNPTTSSIEQIPIPRVAAMPRQPSPWRVIDWHGKAETLHNWLFETQASQGVDVFFNVDFQASLATLKPGCRVVTSRQHNVYSLPDTVVRLGPLQVSATSLFYNGTVPSMPAYLGLTHPACCQPGQALANVGAVYGSVVAGVWSGRHVGAEFVKAYVASNGVVWNNPPGLHPANVSTFWYGFLNQFFVHGILEKLDLDNDHTVLAAAVDSWARATEVMSGNFAHTGFDFGRMTPIDNGEWTEGDVAGGVAWLGVVAAEVLVGKARQQALEMATTALTFLSAQARSPLYECIMPLGALAAARMNANHAGAFDVQQLLEWSLSDGNNTHRGGWGMISADWGPSAKQVDVGGLIGSITDGGGYAFSGNGIWFVAMLSPVPRYQPQFARAIARWVYRVASSTRYFFGDQPEVQGHQSNPRDRWDVNNVVAYEGLRRCDYNRTVGTCLHGDSFGPFATGDWCEMLDCDNISWACPRGIPCSSASNRVLYGGAAIGVLAGVVASTNDSLVPQLDLQATDVHPSAVDLAYLVYNPRQAPGTTVVSVRCPRCTAAGTYSIADLVAGQSLGTCAVARDHDAGPVCSVNVELYSDTAAVVVFTREGA